MYRISLNITVVFSCIFFLNANCSFSENQLSKRDPEQYDKKDAIIRYNQIDHENRGKDNPVSDSELLKQYYSKKFSKFKSKECPDTLSYGPDRAVLTNLLSQLKQMDSLNFILNWPKIRQRFFQIDMYKPVIKKLDKRFITEYRDTGCMISIDENNESGVDAPPMDIGSENIDLEILEKSFFDNWRQGVELLFDRDNDHDKAFPFLNAAVNVDNGYYSKGTIAAVYKLTDGLDKTLSLLKEKVSLVLMGYYKNKEKLTRQELDWCFLYNKLLLTTFKKDELGLNKVLCSEFKDSKAQLFDIVFNNKLKEPAYIMRCLVSGALLHKNDEEYRQNTFIKKVQAVIKNEVMHSLDFLWPALFFARSVYAGECIKSLFSNKKRNSLFEKVNPILYHNAPFFKIYLKKKHINLINDFLSKNSLSYQHKLLLSLATIFNLVRSLTLKKKADTCLAHQSINNENKAIHELEECCKGIYKERLLKLFDECNVKRYLKCDKYASSKRLIEKWLECLKGTIGTFLAKNDLLLLKDVEKNPEIGIRSNVIYEVMESVFISDKQCRESKTITKDMSAQRDNSLGTYVNLCKKHTTLNYFDKNVLLCFFPDFHNKNKLIKELFDQSVDLLACSPFLYCTKIVDKKAIYPYYGIRLMEVLENCKQCADDLALIEKDSIGDLEKEGRDPADCMSLALLGTSIDQNYRHYFSDNLQEHYNKIKNTMLYITSFLYKKNGFDYFPRLIFDRTVASMSYIAKKEQGMGAILVPIIEEMKKKFNEITGGTQCQNLFESIGEAAKHKIGKKLYDEVEKTPYLTKKNPKNLIKKKK